MSKHQFIVDGGYLSWTFGHSNGSIGAWNREYRSQFLSKNGAVFLMDDHSRQQDRKIYYPEYKSRRAEKKAEDPVQAEKARSVRRFVDDILLEDPSLMTVSYPGLEADDLIAVSAFLRHGFDPLRVIGTDKDLLQLRETMYLERIDNSLVEIPHFAKKMPKAVGQYMFQPWHILMTLALMGDKSDSVPRCLPNQAFGEIGHLYTECEAPFSHAWELFGEEFIRNLYLVILPSPWCFETVPDPEDLPMLLDTKMFRTLKIKDDILELLQSVKLLAIPFERRVY